jgi:AcrR family transcriptional regulator
MAVDHRRATAERNRESILDAAERILGARNTLTMAALAAEAGISRPTLYAHFKTLGHVVEAAAQRAVDGSLATVRAARTDEGPADEALLRMADASWTKLADFDALTRGAAEYLPAGYLHRTHAPLMAIMAELVERGQADGTFRADLPPAWLDNVYYTLIHGADQVARSGMMSRDDVLGLLKTTLTDVFVGSR